MGLPAKELRAALGDRIFKNILVTKHLSDVITANPLVESDHWDLNPHLNILHLINKVIAACNEECEDLTPTEQDVMLVWLTLMVYHGKVT